MPLNANRTNDDFTFKHTGQVDEYGASVGNYPTVQENFDSRAEDNLADMNNIKDYIRDEMVTISDDQTIEGVKTFSSSPIVPAPTTDMQAATKKYVDDNSPVLEGSIHDQFLGNDAGDIKARFASQMADIAINIKTYGAKGDGITDDSTAIITLSQSNKTLLFPPGEYLIKSHILIENMENITWIGQGNVKIIDNCKDVLLVDGVTFAKTPNGITFNGCSNIRIENIPFVNVNATYGQINPLNISDRVPQLDFNNTNGITLIKPYFDGQVGAYIENTSDIVLKDRLSSFLLRIYNSSDILIDNIGFGLNAGGGEFMGIGDSKNIKLLDNSYVQEGDTTFWSYLKLINNDDVYLNNLYIESTSTASLMDVSGNRLRLNNVYADIQGQIIDITNEWVGIQTDTNDLVMKNCFTNGTAPGTEIIDYTEEYAPLSLLENIVLDNVVSGKYGVNTRLMKNFKYTNSVLFNLQYINYAPLTLPIQDRLPFSYKFENLKITSDSNIDSEIIYTETHGLGDVKFTNCDIELPLGINYKGLRLLDRYIPNTTNTVTDLTDSIVKFTFENTNFKNTQITIEANVEFINCRFDNCGFIQPNNVASKNINPVITFKCCEFNFINGTGSTVITGKPFNFLSLYELNFDNCKINGVLDNANGYDLCYDFKSFSSNVNIENTTFDLIRGSGSSYSLLSTINGTTLINIKVKNSHFTEKTQYGVVTSGSTVSSPTQFAKLEFFNNTFDAVNGIRIPNTTAGANNATYLTAIGNRFIASTITQLETGKTTFAKYIVDANGEW